MDTLNLDKLKNELLISLNSNLKNQKSSLWKFWIYYFLIENKKLKTDQIYEIRNFLSSFIIPRDDLNFLDDDIVTFLIGYNIFQKMHDDKEFNNKIEVVKEELEKYWNKKNKLYFNSDIHTLLILLFNNESPHKKDILNNYKETKDFGFFSIVLMILEQEGSNNLKDTYEHFLSKIQNEYFSIPDSEKIYIVWILWKYRKLSKMKIKKIREIVSNYIFTVDYIIPQINEGVLNFETALYYDLLFNFDKNTRISFEEIPFTYRMLGYVSGASLIILTLNIDYQIRAAGYLHHKEISLTTIINAIIILISLLIIFLSFFLIYEIGFKGIYNDNEIRKKLKILVLDKWFWGFIISTLIFGTIASLYI